MGAAFSKQWASGNQGYGRDLSSEQFPGMPVNPRILTSHPKPRSGNLSILEQPPPPVNLLYLSLRTAAESSLPKRAFSQISYPSSRCEILFSVQIRKPPNSFPACAWVGVSSGSPGEPSRSRSRMGESSFPDSFWLVFFFFPFSINGKHRYITCESSQIFFFYIVQLN